jgi:hypothetical protein
MFRLVHWYLIKIPVAPNYQVHLLKNKKKKADPNWSCRSNNRALKKKFSSGKADWFCLLENL